MVKVAPSILSADFSKLGDEVGKLKELGADLIHIDVMDGHFVPNITIGPSVIGSIRNHSDLEFDVHLMISNPDIYIESFVYNGADIITVHAESTPHLNRSVQLIKDLGKKAGVALNPSTSIYDIEYILPFIDIVLVMTVNPGFGGQKFINNSINKIKDIKKMINKYNTDVLIEVDGGITLDNAKEIVSAGADILVAGSSIYKAGNVSEAISKLKYCI